jgi:putative PIN family toxin of toxin-antitoxin system
MVCISRPVRVVLDTNVALDWLVFDDVRFRRLALALEEAVWTLISDRLCLEELKDVLARPQIGVSQPDQEKALARYCGHAEMIPDRPPVVGLPQCRDPDDQLFLELAERGGATLLISRDKELLRLDPQMRLICGVAVLDPVAALPELGL